jgi:hypothetical protein
MARLCRTIENSTRKSASSLDNIATDGAAGLCEGGGFPLRGWLIGVGIRAKRASFRPDLRLTVNYLIGMA